MFRAEKLLLLVLPLVLVLPLQVSAQGKNGVVGKVGIGVNGNLNFPIFGMKDRFRATETWGTFLTYARGARTTVEVEYHRSRFDPGKLEESIFFWPQGDPDKWKRYKSPLGRNFMTINMFTINGLYHFVDREPVDEPVKGVVTGLYFTFGGGLYHYTNSVSDLIFPGQPDLGAGLDDTLVLKPFKDTDVAWGFHVGVGAEVLMNDRTGLDVRGRWHMMVGELRPLEAYGMARTFPMGYFDFGISLKHYIGRL